jgi:hypothetical protein
MRAVIVVLALLCAACGSSSPTAPAPPTPTPTPVPTPTPPPIATIQVSACPDAVPGMDLGFYKQIGCNAFDTPLQPVRRWTIAPKVYLKTVDEAGAPIDTLTLDTVQNAMIETAMAWTGNHFGLEGVLRGTDTREGVSGWITVKWPATAQSFCGLSDVAVNGGTIELNNKTASCGCNGSRVRPHTARHELGHALGYWHTDNTADVMSNVGVTKPCDQQPSARELQAAAYQYR